jgi:hypothetical protein
MEVAIFGGLFMLIALGVPALVMKYKVEHGTKG